MALTMTPLTELDAVNVMLMSIGQSPVNALDSTGIKDIEISQLILHNMNRTVQSEGWAFNTDFAFKLAPDGNNRILVPSNAMFIDPVSRGEDFVQRYDETNNAMSMYDLSGQTFDRATDLSVDITWFFAFEKIPQVARDYIGIRAARVFQAGAISSELLFRFEQIEEDKARTNLMRHQSRTKDRNILSGPGFSNQIFHRRRNP